MQRLSYFEGLPKPKVTLAALSKTLMIHIKRGEEIDQIEDHLNEQLSYSRRSPTAIAFALEDESYCRQFKTLLGFLYYRGIGIDIDCDKAVEAFKVAAENDHSYAYFFLGLFHEKGISLPQDYEEALNNYIKSAKIGNAAAAYRLAKCYLEGGLNVDEDSREGFYWARKAAIGGHVAGQTLLGKCYHDGIGTVQNYTRAKKWYTLADRGGDTDAQLRLGLLYEDGLGTYKDVEKAFDLFYRSANSGNAEAQYKLATCYQNGIGTKRMPAEYKKWMRISLENGNDDAGDHLRNNSSVSFSSKYYG